MILAGVYPIYFLIHKLYILLNYLDTTPQAKHRFKYLSCINKDYWLIDWLIGSTTVVVFENEEMIVAVNAIYAIA